jgi:hypothetical protein
VTAAGLEELRRRLPFADLRAFARDPQVSAITDLFTVEMIARYVESKVGAPAGDLAPDGVATRM